VRKCVRLKELIEEMIEELLRCGYVNLVRGGSGEFLGRSRPGKRARYEVQLAKSICQVSGALGIFLCLRPQFAKIVLAHLQNIHKSTYCMQGVSRNAAE